MNIAYFTIIPHALTEASGSFPFRRIRPTHIALLCLAKIEKKMVIIHI